MATKISPRLELMSAKRAIEENPRNSLGWYLGACVWNRVLVSAGDAHVLLLEEVGRPSNVDLEEGFTVTPEFDLAQPLRKLN